MEVKKNMRRRLTDLMTRRTTQLNAAEAALAAGNQAEYDSAMEQIRNMNAEIDRINDLITEQERSVSTRTPDPAEAHDMAEERGHILMSGGSVAFNFSEVCRGIRNATTLATGTLVQPTGAGSAIRDGHNAIVSSIVDQVQVLDLEGMGAYQEPYVVSDMTANAGAVAANAGKLRAETDGTFGIAEIKPVDVNTTSYVDRNISRLSPAAYYAKVEQMALRALRRKVAGLIVNGDGSGTPAMYGITNAKNKSGVSIVATTTFTELAASSLDELYFAYGDGASIGADARLILTKTNLKALGQIRGTNEKKRVFEITPDAGKPNTGIIRDGGMVIPYTLIADITDNVIAYGDPMNYGLGLFGNYSIRVDESYKAGERLLTVLGDVMVGGNVIAHHGFVVSSKRAG